MVNPRMYDPFPPDARIQVRSGVGILIRDAQGRLLMEKRSDSGRWGFPGGRVEPGESIASTAVREALEETGLTVRVTRLLGVYSGPERRLVTYPDGNRAQLVDTFVEAEILSGALLERSPESLALRFFAPGELPPRDELAPPAWDPLADALAGRQHVLA